MPPLVLYEIAKGFVDILAWDFTVCKHTRDRLGGALQTRSPVAVLTGNVTDLCRRRGIANFQLGEDQVFLG
jgi:hypothetical protein